MTPITIRPPSGISGQVPRAVSDYIVEIYSALNGITSRLSNLEVQARTVLAQPTTETPPSSMTTGVNTGDQLLTVSPIRKVTSNTTITLQDEMILVNAVAGNITVTLPPISTVPIGQRFSVKKIDSNALTLVRATGDANIDGVANWDNSTPNGYGTVQSDGTEWWRR